MSNSNKEQLMSKRETTWFRGIAAVMIVLSHYAEWWSWFVPTQGNAETIRYALSKLGVYGVDIFFLFSGYAMVKSLGQECMHLDFVWKRIKNVYIPYLIVIGIIELLSGGFSSINDFIHYLTGRDYWYMAVLFIFYIGFIAVYSIMGGKGPRVVTFCIFTYIFSNVLYSKGMHDFWYVSNIAFAIGVIVGEYEEPVKKLVEKLWIPLVIILSAGMVQAVRSGLKEGTMIGSVPGERLLFMEISATVVWTFLILVLASKCRIKDKTLAFLGKHSLYIYLIHTYVFMRCVNNFKLDYLWIFVIAAVITVVVAYLLNRIIEVVGARISQSNNVVSE